jgi:putative transposase
LPYGGNYGNLKYREFYRRHLPHFQPRGFPLFITFRLANSLPIETVARYSAETVEVEQALRKIADSSERYRLKENEYRRLFEKWDNALHTTQLVVSYLGRDEVAAVVVNCIHYHDGEWFDLVAFCIMPNHVHLILTPKAKFESADDSLAEIMHNIKRNSAKQANQILGLTGAFWQHENFDHVVRNEMELERIIQYTIFNPVKAGLVDDWTKWKWSYCCYNL